MPHRSWLGPASMRSTLLPSEEECATHCHDSHPVVAHDVFGTQFSFNDVMYYLLCLDTVFIFNCEQDDGH